MKLNIFFIVEIAIKFIIKLTVFIVNLVLDKLLVNLNKESVINFNQLVELYKAIGANAFQKKIIVLNGVIGK